MCHSAVSRCRAVLAWHSTSGRGPDGALACLWGPPATCGSRASSSGRRTSSSFSLAGELGCSVRSHPPVICSWMCSVDAAAVLRLNYNGMSYRRARTLRRFGCYHLLPRSIARPSAGCTWYFCYFSVYGSFWPCNFLNRCHSRSSTQFFIPFLIIIIKYTSMHLKN